MNTLAIEINDAGLTVADGSGVLAVEPGYASVEGGEFLTGATAYAQARLRPRQTSNRYWENLSLDPESAGIEGVGSSAELAYRQLDVLWNRFGGSGKQAVLVVPGHYNREQLGLLLGLVQECRMPVRAMVNAAAAASARPWPGCQLVHLDVHLHRFSATGLRQGDGVAADPEEALNGIGLASLMDLWAKRVAETVRAADALRSVSSRRFRAARLRSVAGVAGCAAQRRRRRTRTDVRRRGAHRPTGPQASARRRSRRLARGGPIRGATAGTGGQPYASGVSPCRASSGACIRIETP